MSSKRWVRSIVHLLRYAVCGRLESRLRHMYGCALLHPTMQPPLIRFER